MSLSGGCQTVPANYLNRADSHVISSPNPGGPNVSPRIPAGNEFNPVAPCVAITNAMVILGELLRGFNETIYKSYIEQNPRN
jgi:hypothetical protein